MLCPARGGVRASAGEEAPVAHSLRRALAETRVVLQKADLAYAAHACPASGECCQLARRAREPWLWPTEWHLLLDRLKKDGRALPPARTDGGCPFLDSAGLRCTVYADRPFGCRTYFCERRVGPSREPAARVAELLLRLEAVAQRTFPEAQGPRPLSEWHAGPLVR